MIDAREMARKLVLGAACWSGAAALAAPFLGGAGAILMFHRISRSDNSPLGLNRHLSVTPDFLDRLLADLKKSGLALVSLDEMLEHLAAGRAGRVVTITADDGWLDNVTEALPVFETHRAPFTVYAAPGLTGGEVLPWWEVVEEIAASRDVIRLPTGDGVEELDCRDAKAKRGAARRLTEHLTREVAEEDQQEALKAIAEASGWTEGPVRRFMDWDKLRRLAAHPLATIGAHTVHHFNLKRLSPEAALAEMTESASIIETETGLRPRHFAYPYGYEDAVGPREVELARQAGFASAVTTRHGVLQPGHARHLHALPRISVNGRFQRLAYMRTLLSGLTTPLANGGRRLVTV